MGIPAAQALKTGTVALAFLLLSGTALQAEPPKPHAPQMLEITVQESVRAAPELAQISAGVMTTAPTAGEALQSNATQMTAVYAALKKTGINDKDMQTAGLNLNPQYSYSSTGDAPTLRGYQANNTVSVTVHDLQNLGKTLDALVAAGANQINGPTFGVKDRTLHLDKARAAAVKNARSRADIYATAAGLKVKKLLSITETPYMEAPSPYPMRAMKAESDAATPVAAGEIELGVSTLVRYELGE